ncbi:MAG TPA: phosphotransferase [Kiritimatiellia bacterium]|nr:phosphotransferase [Kiritimatiellia bacterium]HRU70763.1 phosphotransferase [Kiritimatiellia bacterium]
MIPRPTQAVVLAAGLGTRLRPLTLARPKPLMPLRNVPLLERILSMLEAWGVERIAVNLHSQPEAIQDFLARRDGRASVRTSYEPEILGTAGALRPLKSFLGTEPFWVVNADIAARLSPEPLLQGFAAGDGLAAAWLEPKKGPRTVEADRRGRITCYRSPTPGVPGTFTFCGLQLVSPRLFEFLPDRPFCTLVEAYERALECGVCVQGVAVKDSDWDDAGTVESYLRLHDQRVIKRGAFDAQRATVNAQPSSHGREGTGIWVSEGAEVAPDVRGRRSVVYGGARVLPGSVLKGCVIGGGCVGGRLDGVVCVAADETGDDALPAALGVLGWLPRETAAAFLGARGSDRSFWRLYHGSDRAIYIRYGLERTENTRYAGHARLLTKAGVPVPQVLAELAQRRCLVMEDWGNDSLQTRMKAHPERAEAWYLPVVQALARLHGEGTRRAVAELDASMLEPPFDAALYGWEHGLFEEHMLKGRYGYAAMPDGVANELREVAVRLMDARQVLVHRDCQSSNVLFRGKCMAFIDFQGLRMGAAAYDLASLLYDPYVTLTPELRERLAQAYGACGPDLHEGVRLLHTGAVQRLVQALGAFGRLASVGQAGFSRHILPALQYLLEAADICGLDAVGGLAEELIAKETVSL